MTRTRSVLVASGVLALGISGFAGAATNDVLREGVRNGTATRETQIISNNRATDGPTGGFATRQSNKSSTGGAAVYGCRSNAAASSAPCLRANNLSSGKAFEFAATPGPSPAASTSETAARTRGSPRRWPPPTRA